jgi:hypothetical protein
VLATARIACGNSRNNLRESAQTQVARDLRCLTNIEAYIFKEATPYISSLALDPWLECVEYAECGPAIVCRSGEPPRR